MQAKLFFLHPQPRSLSLALVGALPLWTLWGNTQSNSISSVQITHSLCPLGALTTSEPPGWAPASFPLLSTAQEGHFPLPLRVGSEDHQ